MAGLLMTATCAQAASSSCTPIPEDKIGYQLYNLLRVLRPPQSEPATPPGPPPAAQANAAAPGGAPEAGRGPRVNVPTPPDLLDTDLAAMRKAGFRNMERFNDLLGESLEQYQAVARKNGQNIIGNHGNLDMSQWDKTLSDAVALGQKYVGSAGFGQPGFKTLEDALKTAANLNVLGKAAADKGLHLYLHNHQAELNTKFSYDLRHDGKPQMVSAWEIVAANTDPRYVSFEIDVHWARIGLGVDKFDDLTAFLNKYQNRIVMLHVKDTTADGKITDMGTGTTDWPAVFKAAGPGVRYYIWEYDNVPDVFKSADIAHRFLRCEK